MSTRSALALKIIEEIGLPLLQASAGSMADSVAGDANASSDMAVQEAQNIAELLTRTTSLGAEVQKLMYGPDIDKASQADRLETLALASRIIAGHYTQSRKLPGENEVRRVNAALKAILTYADDFTPDSASIEHLRNLADKNKLFDGNQNHMDYLLAFTPAINAIGNFSFGLSESKIIQDVSEKLRKRSLGFRSKIIGETLQDGSEKLADLTVLKIFANLYAECHNAQTRKILENQLRQEEAENPISLVWKDFDKRVAMLEILAGIFKTGEQNSQSSGTKVPVPQSNPESLSSPAEEEKPIPSQPEEKTVVPSEPSTPKDEVKVEQTASNPMSFFKKP